MSSETHPESVAEDGASAHGAGAAPDPGGARPVSAGERLALLDVLRGFALGGVFLSNLFIWFSGSIFVPREQMLDSIESPLNMAAALVYKVLIAGKFITIFSFLFGLGFAIQTGRAEERGAPVGRLYARRLVVMLLLGVAHIFLLWYGDILHLYALLGFVLLLFRRRSDRTLVVSGLLIAVFATLAGHVALDVLPRLWTSPEAAAAAQKAQEADWSAFQARAFAGFTDGSYLALVRTNAEVHERMFLRPAIIGADVAVFGRFLLGALAGRRRLFHDVPGNRRLFRRLLGWGLLAGVVGNGANVVVGFLRMREKIAPESLIPRIVGPITDEIGALGFAAFYVSAIALLFQRPSWRRALSLLAPAGQMALTNYLGQSALSVLIFCGVGLGLMGKVSGPLCYPLVFGLFSAQILVSHLWLARFRFGPVEWLWRSLTYGAAQPMRRAPEAPAPLRPEQSEPPPSTRLA